MGTFKETHWQNITIASPSKLFPTTQNHIYLELGHNNGTIGENKMEKKLDS